jgi:hypothetical protein
MNMRSKFTGFFIGLILVCNGWFLNAGKYSFSGYLPSVEKKNHAVVIKINTIENQKDFYIHYKTKGLEVFQVRKMKTDEQGNLYYQLSTDNLYGKTIEYFIARTDRIASDSILPVFTITGFTNKGSPEVYFSGSGQGSREGKGSKLKFPLRLSADLSASSRVYDDWEPAEDKVDASQVDDDSESTEDRFDATGDIRLNSPFTGNKTQFGVDAGMTYTHHPEETESRFNLTSMKVKFKARNHLFTAGDLSINGTEFTLGSWNRRGLRYKLEGKGLNLGLFFTNAQQKEGFEGVGIPSLDANILGAEAGFSIGSLVDVCGMFLTGKDNLKSITMENLDKEVSNREGNVYSIWGEMRLFKNKLALNGEFARSNFGSGADNDSIEKKNDNAWRSGVNFTHRFLQVSAEYKKVGREFDSIGNLFFFNGLKGLNTNVSIDIKTFSFDLDYRDEKSNMTNNGQSKLHYKEISTNFSWIIANHVRVGGELLLNNEDYEESTECEDMNTFEYSACLGYIAGPNSIEVELGKGGGSNSDSIFKSSVGIILNMGRFLYLSPNFSYLSTKYFTIENTSKISHVSHEYNAYIEGQVNFIPRYFYLTLLGSWFKEVNTNVDNTFLSAEGILSFNMSWLFKGKIQPTLSLRVNYLEGKNSNNEGKNNNNEGKNSNKEGLSVYCQVHISF